jgi:hypothetical protein
MTNQNNWYFIIHRLFPLLYLSKCNMIVGIVVTQPKSLSTRGKG